MAHPRRSSNVMAIYGNISRIYYFLHQCFFVFSGNFFQFQLFIGYDVVLGSIAAFYVFMVPFTKVEESFNVQVL